MLRFETIPLEVQCNPEALHFMYNQAIEVIEEQNTLLYMSGLLYDELKNQCAGVNGQSVPPLFGKSNGVIAGQIDFGTIFRLQCLRREMSRVDALWKAQEEDIQQLITLLMENDIPVPRDLVFRGVEVEYEPETYNLHFGGANNAT